MNHHLELDYEYLMRRALQCGRSPKMGADADIYRRMERSYLLLAQAIEAQAAGRPPTWGKSITELERECHSNLYEVSDYVDRALAIVLREYSLTAEQKNELNECRRQLMRQTLVDVEAVIDKAHGIMIDAGIELG